MVLWQALLGIATLSFLGAGLLKLRRRKEEQTMEKTEVTMPTISLLGNSAREYNSREVRIPEPKAAPRVAKTGSDGHQEIPLISVEDLPKKEPRSGNNDAHADKKNDQDWTPVDFFGEEKEKQ